jgi:aminoglycoside 6'-N-acetyltransferase
VGELRGERLLLRPPRLPGDADALAAILAEPEVARWWRDLADPERVRCDVLEAEPGWTIVHDAAVVGWIQYAEETDPDYRHVALDIFLTSALHGRGLGQEAIRLVIGHFVARGHHRFTIDPNTANVRAIRAYTAVGFRPVGVLHAYERGADGSWQDGLLMDLVVTDSAPAP